MSVPLQTVPDSEDREGDSFDGESTSQAKNEAAEILARARSEAEAIVAEARSSISAEPSPLAALGDNAEEIIGQVRKLIKKQRELETDRESMVSEIAALKSERDELVHRLTDAVERMEEMASMTDQDPSIGPPPVQTPPAPRPKPTLMPPHAEDEESPPAPTLAPGDFAEKDTSLAARLRKAEQAESGGSEEAGGIEEDTSLAARLRKAEEAGSDGSARAARMAENEKNLEAAVAAERANADTAEYDDDGLPLAGDGRSFYDRHSAKLPRLEGDGGRSVLSAMGGMRPELEAKGRKGRRNRKK